MRNRLKIEVVVWLRKTDAFATLRDQVLDLAAEAPFESAEYEDMVDFHWRFDTWADGEAVATALSALSDRPEVVLLRLTNFGDLDASITFKDVRDVKH